jgi:predicted dehydrogenase
MTDVPKYNIEDASAVNLEFESGQIGTIFSACYLKGVGGKGGMDIFGQDFHVEYKERSFVTINQKNKNETFRGTDNLGVKEDKAFINAVMTGDDSKIRSPYEDAAKSAALSIAATESLANGEFVKIPKL